MELPISNDNKYKIGTKVAEITHPEIKLIIKDYKTRVYYCSFVDFPEKKGLILFEREILKIEN